MKKFLCLLLFCVSLSVLPGRVVATPDFDKPSLTDTYTNFLSYLKEIIANVATLNKTTPLHPPDGTIRWNRSTSVFEEYSTGSTTWVPIPVAIAGGGSGATTASGARTNLGLGALATKTQVDTADIVNSAVTVAKTSGFGSLATKSTIGTSDITDGAVTTAKTTGFGALAVLSTINGGNWSGTDLAVVDGGTGASSASGARSNLSAAASGDNGDVTNLSAYTISTWSPSITVPSPMGINTPVINDAYYIKVGNFVIFKFSATFNLTGTGSNNIQIDTPMTAVDDGTNDAFIAACDENGTAVSACRWKIIGSKIYVFKGGAANFTVGNNASINIIGVLKKS